DGRGGEGRQGDQRTGADRAAGQGPGAAPHGPRLGSSPAGVEGPRRDGPREPGALLRRAGRRSTGATRRRSARGSPVFGLGARLVLLHQELVSEIVLVDVADVLARLPADPLGSDQLDVVEPAIRVEPLP